MFKRQIKCAQRSWRRGKKMASWLCSWTRMPWQKIYSWNFWWKMYLDWLLLRSYVMHDEMSCRMERIGGHKLTDYSHTACWQLLRSCWVRCRFRKTVPTDILKLVMKCIVSKYNTMCVCVVSKGVSCCYGTACWTHEQRWSTTVFEEGKSFFWWDFSLNWSLFMEFHLKQRDTLAVSWLHRKVIAYRRPKIL